MNFHNVPILETAQQFVRSNCDAPYDGDISLTRLGGRWTFDVWGSEPGSILRVSSIDK